MKERVNFEVGQLVKARVKGVSNDRMYTVPAVIRSLHGPITVVFHAQPYSPLPMRETPVKTAEMTPMRPRRPESYEFLGQFKICPR